MFVFTCVLYSCCLDASRLDRYENSGDHIADHIDVASGVRVLVHADTSKIFRDVQSWWCHSPSTQAPDNKGTHVGYACRSVAQCYAGGCIPRAFFWLHLMKDDGKIRVFKSQSLLFPWPTFRITVAHCHAGWRFCWVPYWPWRLGISWHKSGEHGEHGETMDTYGILWTIWTKGTGDATLTRAQGMRPSAFIQTLWDAFLNIQVSTPTTNWLYWPRKNANNNRQVLNVCPCTHTHKANKGSKGHLKAKIEPIIFRLARGWPCKPCEAYF